MYKGFSMNQLKVKNLRYHKVGPINLTVEASECIVLSGPSGSGKTMMLRAVADLEPHDGVVYLGDVKSNDISGPQWRKKVGMLPAESQWWCDTVGEHFKEYNKQWLEALGLDSTVMNWPISRLSTGERQRLALLRLLMNQPKALLLDEPTANLDPAGSKRVEELLCNYSDLQKTPVIWISHDSRQIQRMAKRHFLLSNGKLLEKPLTGWQE